MAFSEANKKNIRMYLGVPFGFYTLTTRLESMMDHVGSNATDQAQVETWLTRLAEIDTALTAGESGGGSASTTTHGALKKVDEIEFYAPGDSDTGSGSGAATIALVDQGRVLIDRIARALGVSDVLPMGDYFGTRRPLGFAIPLG